MSATIQVTCTCDDCGTSVTHSVEVRDALRAECEADVAPNEWVAMRDAWEPWARSMVCQACYQRRRGGR